MKIESTDLTGMILRGARTAYYADHPWQSPDYPQFSPDAVTFEKWLGNAQRVTATTGRSHITEQLALWCERARDGESHMHIAELPLEDQKAIIIAHRALAAVVELERMAAISERK